MLGVQFYYFVHPIYINDGRLNIRNSVVVAAELNEHKNIATQT